MDLQYSFDVYDPMGPLLRSVPRSQTFMRQAGWRGSVTPDGGCREATWDSVQSGLRLRPADVVRVFGEVAGVSKAIFYGELRQGGNVRDVVGEKCVLRGFDTAFKEIPLPRKSYPTMDAATLVYTAFQDCIAAGDFGTPPLISVTASDFPPLNFTLDVKNTFEESLGALIERVFAQSGQSALLECKVRPNGSAYLKVKKANDLTDVLALPLTGLEDWQAPVQEVITTRVLWYIEQRTDGTWVTHASEHPSVTRYRRRQQRVQVPDNVLAYTVGAVNVVANVGDGPYNGYALTLVDGNKADPMGGAFSTFTASGDDKDVTIEQTLPTGAVRYVLAVQWVGGVTAENRVVVNAPGQPVVTMTATDLGAQLDPANLMGASPPRPRVVTLYDLPPMTVITISGKTRRAVAGPPAVPAQRVTVQLFEARPETANKAVLDAMAYGYYVLPVEEPGRLRAPGLLDPLTLHGHVQVGTYFRPVEAYEYTIEGGPGGGVNTNILTEQADDPAMVALQQLIKYRDQQATLDAVTSQK